ncbi:MAG: hypothetical protein NVS3B18_01820 [Candidatus Dormibacteria bacterium]
MAGAAGAGCALSDGGAIRARYAAAPVSSYRVPLPTIARLGRAMLRLGETTLLADAADVVGAARPPMRLSGHENVPARGPFVFVPNHCERKGLWIGFPSALLTRVLAEKRPQAPPLHWAVVAETRWAGGRLAIPGTRWAYAEVARCYQMVTLPARDDEVAGRGHALRRLARLALPAPRGRGEPIGFYPEGEHGTSATMAEALPGTGNFLALLGAAGVPAVPVGIAESQAGLEVRIGTPFIPERRRGPDGDRLARAEVMSRIAALVPARMRGPHAPRVVE